MSTGGLLPAVVLTTAGLQDRDGACRLLAALRTRSLTIALVRADGGHTGWLVT